MDKVSILIPYKHSDENREASFHWLVSFYKNMLPAAEICIGECHQQIFSRAEAINHASKQATGNVFVIADADIVCNPVLLTKAPTLLNRHPWIIPYSNLIELTKMTTDRLLQLEPSWPPKIKLTGKSRMIGSRLPLGGINIVTRHCFDTVQGFDERFIGWGGEDDAFASSLDTLCGPHARLNADVYHLWHKRSSARNNPYYANNLKLAKAYKTANGNKKQIMKLIQDKSVNP